MSRVSALASAGRSVTAKFHELRLKYWNKGLDVICCFEGSDDIEFFLPHVRSELGLHQERVEFVNCGGKSVVLTLWHWASDRSWCKARLGFFVDRDLDDYISGNVVGDQLYVTDYYSIESHVLDSDFFDSVWQDLFRLPITDARRADWKAAYYSGAEAVASILLPICYTAVAFKREGGGVNFDRVKLDELITISDRGVASRGRGRKSFQYSDVFLDASVSCAKRRVSRRDLQTGSSRSWLRGKFALWYSMAFFTRMKLALGCRSEPNRAVVKAVFSAEAGMSCLCSRSRMPTTLRVFLHGWAALIVRDGLNPVGSVG